MLENIFLYASAFFAIWFGAGLIVRSADKLSKRLRLSSFAVSFFILGMLTSTPEFAVGLTAIANGQPEIFVGNLIGGVPVLFLFIVPLLAILGNGIKLRSEFTPAKILLTFTVILAPAFFTMDSNISNYEAVTMIVLYIMLFFIIQKNRGIFDVKNGKLLNIKSYSYFDLLKVLAGVGIVLVASNVIVDKTIYFAEAFNLSIFLVSILLLSLGTNAPELSLAVRSIILGKKDVAFGDYMGSAAANTFLFGLFTLMRGKDTLAVNNFSGTFIIMAGGLILFFIFTQSKNEISRREGFFLFLVYIVFIVYETLF